MPINAQHEDDSSEEESEEESSSGDESYDYGFAGAHKQFSWRIKSCDKWARTKAQQTAF